MCANGFVSNSQQFSNRSIETTQRPETKHPNSIASFALLNDNRFVPTRGKHHGAPMFVLVFVPAVLSAGKVLIITAAGPPKIGARRPEHARDPGKVHTAAGKGTGFGYGIGFARATHPADAANVGVVALSARPHHAPASGSTVALAVTGSGIDAAFAKRPRSDVYDRAVIAADGLACLAGVLHPRARTPAKGCSDGGGGGGGGSGRPPNIRSTVVSAPQLG